MPATVELLLVDDETEVTRMLSLRLGKRGYSCRCVHCAEDALQLVQQSAVHIIILDVKMPGMGGMEMLHRVREGWPDIAVILLSGHADMQTAVSAMQGGALGYLMKPVDFDELLFKIEDACMQLKLEARL